MEASRLRAEPWALALVGAGLVAGGALHPDVPAGLAEQMGRYASHALWEPAHWVLTLSQLAGVGALALVLARLSAAATLLRVGVFVSIVGLVLGTLGTLSAATALVEAARAEDAVVFGVLAAWTMGVGWLCLVASSAGAGMASVWLARAGATPATRALARVALLGSGAFLLGALVLGPFHAWTHPYLLRFGAIGFGLLMIGVGLAWPRQTAASATQRDATEGDASTRRS